MQAKFLIKLTCEVSEEKDIAKLQEELKELSLGAAGIIYANEYSIDSVELARTRPSFESLMGRGNILCVCGVLLMDKASTFEHWQRGHFDRHFDIWNG